MTATTMPHAGTTHTRTVQATRVHDARQVHASDVHGAGTTHDNVVHAAPVQTTPTPARTVRARELRAERRQEPLERLERFGTGPGARALRVAVMGKGGATKTTSTASLGDALERLTGWPTVLVDLDAQPSLSRWLAPRAEPTLVEVLSGELGGAPDGKVFADLLARDVAVELRPGLHLLPAHDGLADLTAADLSVSVLAEAVEQVGDLTGARVGVVLIDTPPAQPVTSGSLLLGTALAAADVVVIPFALGVKAVDAMRMVLADVQAVRPGVPVLLLPANVDGAVHVDAGLAVTAALRPDLRVATAVPHDARHLVRDAEDAGRLLADYGRPSNATVRAYATAAGQLAELLLEVGRELEGDAGVQA